MIAKLSVCVCVCVGVRVMRGFQVHRNLRFYVSMCVCVWLYAGKIKSNRTECTTTCVFRAKMVDNLQSSVCDLYILYRTITITTTGS